MSILDSIEGQYDSPKSAMTQGVRSRPANITEKLKAQKTELEAHLSRINAALAGLEANPGFEETLNLLSQV